MDEQLIYLKNSQRFGKVKITIIKPMLINIVHTISTSNTT